ncbi:MAG: glycosyltransferase family 4 protein [Isosphaeraceae bacterium]
MSPTPKVGYVGVDVLNNATVCNEATGLLAAGVPLEVASVYPHRSATYYHDETLDRLRAAVRDIYPIRPAELAGALLGGPFRFGMRFWKTLAAAAFGPAEGPKQRLTLLYQFLPGLVLATRWRNAGIGHIHAHWAHTATSVAMHAAGLLGVGFSFTGHANDLFVHRVALLAKVRRARFIVCISEYHRKLYLDMGAEPDRLKVVYCGIDTRRFAADAESRRLASVGRPRVVSVGRLVEKKGFHDLIAACARLRDDGVDCECVIAGSGPERDRLRRLIDDHALADRVTVTGETVLQEDLPGLLRSSAVLALPCVRDRDGDMDGLPSVLTEAMLCGVPVVSTRFVGIPDLVRDGETGRLVEPGDVPALAEAVRSLLESPEESARLGEAGRAWALEHFDRDEAVRRLSRLFGWCASHPGHDAPEPWFPSAPEAARVRRPASAKAGAAV